MHSPATGPWGTLAALWGIAPDSPGPKPRYSVAAVAQAGIRVADERGLGAVTLQVVAKELGLTTTALYRYVDAKDTLVEVMADVALGPAPELAGSLADRIRSWCRARWRVLQAHPWLAEVTLRATPRGPDGVAWTECLVAGLVETGVGDPLGVARLLEIMVHGFAGGGDAFPADPPTWWAASVDRTAPRMTELLQERTSGPEEDLGAAVERLIASLVIESAYGVRPPSRRA